MSKKSPHLYLEDILTSIIKIEEYINGFSLESFTKDQKTIDAVIRNLEIIGEAANNIPEEYIEKYTDIPWQEMISMRNKVIHEYFGIDIEILWQTIREDLPKLKEQIKKLPEVLK
ncbi:MAG: DUF86 domain-containing protein [Candidatus Daviesbacteria bacterium]|nr:DUF86 domain-containing protein [Candidatus Daviesbacteria bacterium]